MDTKALKKLVASKLEKYEKEFSELIEQESRETTADYIKAAILEGKINALLEVLMDMSRA